MRFALSLVVVVSALTIGARHVRAQARSGLVGAVSSSVVASWQAHENDDGTSSLDLLVLWRGTPGWFTRTTSTGGGVGGGGTGNRFGTSTSYEWMSYNGRTLEMVFESPSKTFNAETTVLKILGREIPLRDTNVVLIDGADTGVSTIVGTQYVDPRFSGPDPVAAIVKRSPDLFAFLQCDAVLPDTTQQAMGAALCARMRP